MLVCSDAHRFLILLFILLLILFLILLFILLLILFISLLCVGHTQTLLLKEIP